MTGDATDNCQLNELRSYIALLDGGQILPDSGDPGRYEGVSAPGAEDERYWHRDGGPEDLPRTRFGLPAAPGVLDAARLPFRSAGLGMPWYAVHGNHDNMLLGTAAPEGWLRDYARRRGEVPDPARWHRSGRDPAPVRAGRCRRAG